LYGNIVILFQSTTISIHGTHEFPGFKQIECGEKFGASIDVHGKFLVWGCGDSHSPTGFELPAPAVYIATGPIMLTGSSV
jgi:hypothetical protein